MQRSAFPTCHNPALDDRGTSAAALTGEDGIWSTVGNGLPNATSRAGPGRPGRRFIPRAALAAYARATHRTERPLLLLLVALPVRSHVELPLPRTLLQP